MKTAIISALAVALIGTAAHAQHPGNRYFSPGATALLPQTDTEWMHGVLRRFNEQFNAAHKTRYVKGYALTWAQEGVDGFDCKWLATEKAKELHEQFGIPLEAMSMRFLVDGRHVPYHVALEVFGDVLDEGPYLDFPEHYDATWIDARTYTDGAIEAGFKP